MNLPVMAEFLRHWRADLDARLGRIEATLRKLNEAPRAKEAYTVAEFAALVNRTEYTVREWARLGRVNGEKTIGGRGDRAEWRFSSQELIRYQREGLMEPRPPGRGSPGSGGGPAAVEPNG